MAIAGPVYHLNKFATKISALLEQQSQRSDGANRKDRDAIIDGEIVCLGPDGRSLFRNLMYKRGEPYFYAVDLLWLDGMDLRGWPLIDRKKELRGIVPSRGSRLLYVDHVVGHGEEMFRLVCRADL